MAQRLIYCCAFSVNSVAREPLHVFFQMYTLTFKCTVERLQQVYDFIESFTS